MSELPEHIAKHFRPPPWLDISETDDRFTNDLVAAKREIAALANRAFIRMQGPYNWATESDQEWT